MNDTTNTEMIRLSAPLAAANARIAELEARIAELQPMAECAAIMAFCGYFSRMRGPCCYKVFTDHEDYEYIDDGVPVGYPSANIIPLYAGSAPVPAVVSQNDADLRHNAACVQPTMCNADRYETLQSELATARLIIEEARAILENCTGGGYAGDTGVLWDSKRHELLDRLDSSAPVPQPASFREVAEVPTANMEGGYCCQCGHELCDDCVPLHPIPLPAAVPEAVAKDAARYRWSRADGPTTYIVLRESAHLIGVDYDAAIDAAMLAAAENEVIKDV